MLATSGPAALPPPSPRAATSDVGPAHAIGVAPAPNRQLCSGCFPATPDRPAPTATGAAPTGSPSSPRGSLLPRTAHRPVAAPSPFRARPIPGPNRNPATPVPAPSPRTPGRNSSDTSATGPPAHGLYPPPAGLAAQADPLLVPVCPNPSGPCAPDSDAPIGLIPVPN